MGMQPMAAVANNPIHISPKLITSSVTCGVETVEHLRDANEDLRVADEHLRDANEDLCVADEHLRDANEDLRVADEHLRDAMMLSVTKRSG